jgi:hypothetical protein
LLAFLSLPSVPRDIMRPSCTLASKHDETASARGNEIIQPQALAQNLTLIVIYSAIEYVPDAAPTIVPWIFEGVLRMEP